MIEGTRENGNGNGKKLRYGMIGGGPGAFIGEVHRKAIGLDGMAELAAGCFSRSWEKTLETGRILGLSEERLYQDYLTMAEKEANRPDPVDFVVVVTPNAQHYGAVKAFLSKGIPVVCDKPLTFETEEAEELAALAKRNNALFAVTYTYTGYPAVKQARELIAAGEIGDIRFVNAEYPADRAGRPETGLLAYRPCPDWKSQLYRRYRQPCRKPCLVCYRPENQSPLCAAGHVRTRKSAG